MKQTGQFIKAIKRSFLLTFRFAPWITFSLLFGTVAMYLLPIWQSRIMGDVVNQIVENVRVNAGVVPAALVLLYAGIWGFSRVLGVFNTYLNKLWGLYIEEELELMISRKRFETDISHYEDPNFQNLMTRAFNRGFWPILGLASAQFDSLANIALLIVASTVAVQLNPTVYLIVFFSLLPSLFAQIKYGAQKWHIWAENSPRQRKYAHLRSHAIGRNGIIQTKILQAKDKILGMIKEILSSFREDQLKVDNTRLWYMGFSNLIVAAGFASSFYLIIRDVNSGLVGVGELVFLIAVLGQLIGAANSFISGIAKQYEEALVVIDIFQFMDTPKRIIPPENPKALNLQSAPQIELRNVWFKYDGQNEWVLRGINLTIAGGEKIALVGENGAGKTTLIKLLSRTYDPTKGSILINGTNLKEIDLDEWGSYLAILLQDYRDYEFQAWESISMGRSLEEISREKAIRAAELASADLFIEKWKSGYDQQIGREFGGVDPSKGQSQKIAIARTIYRDGLIIVLDEPTASVDAKSEEKIFDRMEETSSGKTLILISHRFNTTAGADRIIVLENGKIMESGNHRDLLQKNGRYAEMWHSQAKVYQEENQEEVGQEENIA